MRAHTPGPWIVRGGNVIESLSRINVAKAWMTDGEEECANARLIAAAPDLLEALQDIANGGYEDKGPNHLGFVNMEREQMIGLARAAIAKAKREAK